jgi:pyruvate ferredoxin oxidoreductase alpha subunit
MTKQKKVILTGAQAASNAMRQINPDVVSAFPITPQTDIMMDFTKFVANGLVDTEMILVESEHSAMSGCVGASAAGARAMTATSSAGLALMFEVCGVASGTRLPIVMNIVNRALSSPINIHCDHADSMACRDIGWIQMYSEDAQEVYDNTLLAVRLAEKMMLPAMVMQDGFITSHCVQNMQVLPDNIVKRFVGTYKPKHYLLNVDKPVTMGPLELQDYYFETQYQRSMAMMNAKKEYLRIGKELTKITGREYPLFETYKMNDAKAIIVTMSSAAGTTKHVVDEMRKRGKKVGMLKIRLFRPFPYTEISKALTKIPNICVLDRSESFGANPPLYSEIKNCVDKKIVSCVFGLGGRDLFENDIEKVYNILLKGRTPDKFIGVRK